MKVIELLLDVVLIIVLNFSFFLTSGIRCLGIILVKFQYEEYRFTDDT